jgi:hypothetical protein
VKKEFWDQVKCLPRGARSWRWIWVIGGNGSNEPECSIVPEGVVVRWNISSEDLSHPQVILAEWSRNLRAQKLRPRMHVQEVILHNPESCPGDIFRQFLAEVLRWIGTDPGIYIRAEGLGHQGASLDAWESWRIRIDRLALGQKEFLNYCAMARTIGKTEAWIESFQKTSEYLPGWIEAFGSLAAPFPALSTSAPLPAVKRRRERVGRWCLATLWGASALVLMLCLLGGFLHQSRALQVKGVFSESIESGNSLKSLSLWTQANSRRESHLKKMEAWIPPGYGFPSERKSWSAQDQKWLMPWRDRFLKETASAMKQCDQGGPGSSNCELFQGTRFRVWNMVTGMVRMDHAQTRKEWSTMLFLEDLGWDGALDSWLDSVRWTRMPLEADSVILAQYVGKAQRMDGAFQNFIQDRQDLVAVDLLSFNLPVVASKALYMPRIAFPEAQAGVENWFEGIEDYSLQKAFLERLQAHQWELWKMALGKYYATSPSLLPNFEEVVPPGLIRLRSSLQLAPDTSQLSADSVLAQYRSQTVRTDLVRMMGEDWMQVWPLSCQLSLADINPEELVRHLSPQGTFDVWKEQRHVAQVFESADTLTRERLSHIQELQGFLFNEKGEWKEHRLHWSACATEHWDLMIQMDTVLYSLPQASGTCLQGTLLWPKSPQSIRIVASRGALRKEWRGQGIFALSRMIQSWGTWRDGVGSEMRFPLVTADFVDTFKMSWQQAGQDPRLVKPCGLSIQQ